jgi:hypothetical protein
MSKHWKITEVADGWLVGCERAGDVADFLSREDAELACHRVNTYPAIEAENKRLREALESILEEAEIGNTHALSCVREVARDAKAALEAAKGDRDAND